MIDALIALFVWVLSVACLLVVPLVVLVPYIGYVWLSSGSVSADLASDKNVLFVSILGVIPAHIVTFVLVWFVVSQAGRRPFWKVIGFEWPKSLGPIKGFVLSAASAIVLLSIGLLVTKLVGGEKTQLDLLIESSTQARIATAIIAFLTAPLVEEIVYRGVLYSAFERVIGAVGAVAIVSILFAAVHFVQYSNNLAVIGVITLLSVCLTTVRAKTGKLMPPFIIHLVFNGIQSLVLILQPFENSDPAQPTPAPGLDVIVTWLLHSVT